MDGQTIGIAIAIVAAVALATGLIWLFGFGRRNEWPEGESFRTNHGRHLATVVWSPAARPLYGSQKLAVALAVAHAAASVAAAWKEVKGTTEAQGRLAEVGLWVLADEEFEVMARKTQPHLDPKNVSAWLVHVPRRLGSGPPMAVMRFSLVEHALKTGQPLIHEFLHDVGLLHDRGHTDPTVWSRRDDVLQVEERAAQIFGAT
jgi:hypothetical protein